MSKVMMLERGGWYGWTMWPGYLDTPYHSPIRVEALNPCKTGNGRFDLTFINTAYAQGVADMTYQLRMLKRGPGYLLASVEDSERAVCIERLDLAWLENICPMPICPSIRLGNAATSSRLVRYRCGLISTIAL